MRIFEHEATVFIGNGIKFGVGNAGISRHVCFCFSIIVLLFYCSADFMQRNQKFNFILFPKK
jgi:hypothetical protein